MKYTAKYKKGLFWRKIEDVIADGYVEDRNVRFFILEDKSRIEISSRGVIFEFPPQRERLIQENLEKQTKVK